MRASFNGKTEDGVSPGASALEYAGEMVAGMFAAASARSKI